MERLDKVDVGPEGERLGPLRGIARAGEDHDAHVGTRGEGLQMLQEFRAMALGQVEIEQENIGTGWGRGLGELVKKAALLLDSRVLCDE